MATGQFSIDDAFESDDEDHIRTYGSTTEHMPLRKKVRPPATDKEQEIDGRIAAEREMDDLAGTGLLNSKPRRVESSTSLTSSLYTDNLSVTTKTFSLSSFFRHPKVRENWKIVLASFLLLSTGLILVIAGVAVEIAPQHAIHSFVFFIAGIICIIPGDVMIHLQSKGTEATLRYFSSLTQSSGTEAEAYHVVYIACAVRGRRGFSFYNLPTFK